MNLTNEQLYHLREILGVKMSENNEITITNNSTIICINIPINTLIFAQENRPDILYKITDKNKMVEYFRDRFWEFGTDENRGSHIEELIDNFFSDAYEYGEAWLEMVDEESEYE